MTFLVPPVAWPMLENPSFVANRFLVGWLPGTMPSSRNSSGGSMHRVRLLWTLVAANVLLTFASVGAEGFLGWTLAPELKEYMRSRFADPWSTVNMARLILLA